ncbi:MAG: gliding motility-associated ABC transporter ATP-binding subunit GldA [Prevotellaceae bacterium]|jgi:ABC-2 type transport system ATP-binding protein|nr:gliding motility-associated ABC transporter ATP-binding subunit GldA [Prevotellaceae bacterium]
MSVSVDNISKFYGKQQVLNNICFEAVKGEVLGFLGPNGAGKSTTMKIITGFIAAASGHVTVNGIDVEKNPQTTSKLIGYLPESNPLYYDMYVREYLKMSGQIYGIKRKLKDKIEDVLQLTGLMPEAHKKAGQLSKGYRQRLGLAQAILHNPDVLILDEPTTGLDPNQIVEIRNLIKNIGKEKTVILSTHIMQEVEAVCDRAIVINKGKIVADKSIESLKSMSLNPVQRVEVEFLQNQNINTIKNIKFGKIIETYSPQHFLIESATTDDIRIKIFNHAKDNNLIIITLREKEQHLEEVFRIITNKN